ncbi:MAG: hypothetical protein GY913_28325 [Proteobacteria bacterium]|nr:hypothetical protein [Pseudomonadota bacterium]MCP4920819.1 hypothetical protein [Pseudomonadota bacterium]
MFPWLLACVAPVQSGLEDIPQIDLSDVPRNHIDELDVHGLFDAWFTEPGVEVDTEAETLLDDAIIALIEASTTSLDLSLYELGEQPLIDAVLEAHDRGVTVRMAGDGDEGHDAGYEALIAAGIPISMRKPGDRIMHDKYIIADSQVVWTGSTNFSHNGIHRNNNNGVMIESSELASHFQKDFDQMFVDGLFGRKKDDTNLNNVIDFRGQDLDFYFSPQHDPIDHLVDEVDAAERSVRFMIFSFTHPDLTAALLRAQERGVEIYGIYDESQGRGRYSTDETIAGAGIPSWIDGNHNSTGFSGGKMHHKAMVIDSELPTGRVVMGSFNWSKSATDYNDENLLVLRDGGIVRLFEDEFCARVVEATLHPSYVGELPEACPPIVAGVFINEFLPNPDGTDRGSEFVELVNGAPTPVDLTGWTFGDAIKDVRHTFDGVVLAPGEALVLWDSGEHEGDEVSATGSLSLNNTGDTLTLRDADGLVVDEVEYGDSETDVSWNRSPDFDGSGDWALHDTLGDATRLNSPGIRANAPASQPGVRLVINELLPDPTGTDRGAEYIELVNVGDVEADLTGWLIGDLVDSHRHEFDAVILAPGDALTLYDEGDHAGIHGAVLSTSGWLSLNNSGDVVTLYDDAFEVHDQVAWTRSSEGVSLNRATDATAGTELVDHDEVSDADTSPGTRADGTSWLE